MTLIAAEPRITAAPEARNPVVLASWPTRAAALALDVVPGAAVLSTTALVTLAVPLRGRWWWLCVGIGVLAALWTGCNRLLGVGGQSLGRRMFGITLLVRDGSAPGPSRLLWRDMAHLADAVPAFVGWLWPLKDLRRRTFADILAGTVAQVADGRGNGRARRQAAALVLTAAALCALDAALANTVVHQRDRSAADASAEIAAQGPRMVEQILSYHPETLQADFTRARSLTSDAYREQLNTQQQAVQKAGPVRNEYWVTNSAVLGATTDNAAMLLFLQGQRGTAPNQRYLTASVRVSFVKSGSGPWRVDDLTVVTHPQPIQAKP